MENKRFKKLNYKEPKPIAALNYLGFFMPFPAARPGFPHIFVLVSCLLMFHGLSAFAQEDRDQIRQLRAASNRAMKAYDQQKVLSFLTEDVLTTTGNGTLLSGKTALAEYIDKNAGEVYFVRTPGKIRTASGRAWEQGRWKGYDPSKGPDPVVGGNYAAMWVKEGETWLIKSQLFVTLK